MASIAAPLADQTWRTAILIAHSRRELILSPFFSNCEGLLVIDRDGCTKEFMPNSTRTNRSTCNLILATGVTRLVCGFIDEPQRARLCASGMDIRLGSCTRPLEALVREFDDLPVA